MPKHRLVRVTEVEVLHDRVVRIHFDDGAATDRDLAPLLTGPAFQQIRRDDAAFRQLGVDSDFGVITWPNGADVDCGVAPVRRSVGTGSRTHPFRVTPGGTSR